MKYTCKLCAYDTNDKSNYNKHMKSQIHLNKAQELEDNAYKCICGKRYLYQSGLCKHKHTCKRIVSENTKMLIKEVIETVRADCKKENEEFKEGFKEELKEELKKGTEELKNQLLLVSQNKTVSQQINNQQINNTYISIKHYLQQCCADAPALEGLPNYLDITYETDEDGNEELPLDKQGFIDTLVYNQTNSCLSKYLGDFVIQNYKKDDPSQQSMWSSDISRLTYIIKELLANKDSIWNHDYKGVKTKTYIIDPLLKYIRNFIDDYWIETVDKYKTSKIGNINKYHTIYMTLHQINKDIEHDILSNAIIKYIAPYFYMDRKKLDETINIDKNEIQINPFFDD